MRNLDVAELTAELNKTEPVRLETVYEWLAREKPFIPYYIGEDGRKMIRADEAERLLEDWRRSCKPKKFAVLVGMESARGGSLGHMIEKGVVETVNLFPQEDPRDNPKGYNRILLSSLDKAREYIAGKDKRVAENRKALPLRVGGHKWKPAEATRNNIRIWAKRRGVELTKGEIEERFTQITLRKNRRAKRTKRTPEVEVKAPNLPSETLNLDETSRLLGMLGWEVVILRSQGKLPGNIIDGVYSFRRKDVEEFSSKTRRTPASFLINR